MTELMSHGELTVKRRLSPAAAALAASTALLLTACGSGDGKSSDNDKVAGADRGDPAQSASPSPSAATAADRPEVELPSDVKDVYEAQDLPDGEFGAEQNVIVQEIQAVDR
ncbi:hypothetical protein [Streptomyces sp. NPDC002580]|uniref:hypothetical protein n=1 Tax=Streptomyces sp. NPDC002580 TaxID=3364653 RepID=UPI0036CFA4A8